jgi:hypothetical protein
LFDNPGTDFKKTVKEGYSAIAHGYLSDHNDQGLCPSRRVDREQIDDHPFYADFPRQ